MDFISILLLAVGLAMDAFAVSITNGMSGKNIGIKNAVLAALCFGLAQGIMPVLGYFGGQIFSDFLSKIDHWVALILLGFIGIKMIVEAIKGEKGESQSQFNLGIKMILVQAVATSIDALAVGISFAAMKTNIWLAASLIAVITFVICVAGVFIGKKFGDILKSKSEIFGGAVLVFLGLKIFAEHVIF